ncbi:MAG: thymidine phosphorylase [Pseudomonadota bacterium]
MNASAILARLRAGEAPTEAELFWFVNGLADGSISDTQAGAFAMAVCVHGLSRPGLVHLTHAMRASGLILDWDLDGPVIDKHSTGGVGDCTSLILVPALAACGAYVPMISGRGLGHSGGTLDKLEAIPGFRTEMSVDDLQDQVVDIGCVITGATDDIAPADRRLYAVRDVTGTVPSLDLITASILSKKLAAGIEALVLDVKFGSGAFMADQAEATQLARALVETAQGAGCMTSALLTDMNQPLAPAAGNALEVIAVMDALTEGTKNSPLLRLVAALGGELLALGGLAADAADGASRVEAVIERGEAAERFGEMVAAQGGPTDFTDRWRDRLPAARAMVDIFAEDQGFVSGIDTEALGRAVVKLGGGRRVESDRIDPTVGLTEIVRIGARVDADRPLLQVHARDQEAADAVAPELRAAFSLSQMRPEAPPLIVDRIG